MREQRMATVSGWPAHPSPVRRFWVDYVEEADILYLSFRKLQCATDSEMRDDDIIARTAGSNVVGPTILDASTRHS